MIPNQGRSHIAKVDGDWMVVFPDGSLRAFATYPEAERAAQAWFRRNARKLKLPIGVGMIETDPNED
jgi:hypothetical protein